MNKIFKNLDLLVSTICIVILFISSFTPKTHIVVAATGLTQTQGAGAEGTNSWTSPTNARGTSDDNIYATTSPGKKENVEGIWTTYGFGSLIPAGATITKVEIIPQYKVSTTASIAILNVQATVDSVLCPASVATDTSEPTVDTEYPVDITSCFSSWSEDLLNNSSLTVTIGGERGNSNNAVTFSLDYIKLKVTYSTPTFNQSAFRFFNNADSTDVGSALANLNTNAVLASAGDIFRLRKLFHIGDTSWRLPPWTRSTIDSGTNLGSNSSMVIAPDGFPIIAYRDIANTSLKVLKCGNAGCSSGNTLTSVDTSGNTGAGPSMVIGADSLPVIAYADAANLELEIVKCGNITCSSGNTFTTIGSLVGGTIPVLVLGTDNFPVVSYALSGTQINVLKCGNASCSSGNTVTTVHSSGFVSEYTGIAINTDGFPIVSYYDSDTDLEVIKCGNASCSSGNTLVSVDATGFTGSYSSIIIGSDNLPIISYNESVLGDLKVVHCGNTSCSSGNTITTVDSTGDVGVRSNIVIGADNFPIIAYRDTTNTGLKFLKCGNISCSSGNAIQAVDTGGDMGASLSIALGTDGYPVISYRDLTNLKLKFARQSATMKLQYVGKGAGTCASPSGGTPPAYTDVSGSTLIAFKDNATPKGTAPLTSNGSDPTHGGDSISNQTYIESNPFANRLSAVASGVDAKFDFSLYDNGASANTAYCFKVVKSDGSALDTYDQYPQITTASVANSLTFSISDNSIGFGGLLSASARYATGDTTGSASEVEAHTLSASTTATNGYTIVVKGATLTSEMDGSDSVTAIGGTNTASSAGSEQFGIRMNASGGIGTVSSPYADTGFAYDATASTSSPVASASSGDGVTTTYSVRYLGNISNLTEAGTYSTNLSYIITANF